MTAIAERASGDLRRAAARARLDRRFALSIEVPRRFFREEADAVSRAALEMARRFARGGRLLACGDAAQASDAEHVAVEFVHPVLVGKRALPALALTGEVGRLSSRLAALGRPDDIVLVIVQADLNSAVRSALAQARELGMLTLALCGDSPSDHQPGCTEFLFAVPCADPLVVQETHETIYHVFWELVHLFLEHRVTS